MPFPDYDEATELAGGLNVAELDKSIRGLSIASAVFQGIRSHEGTCSTVFDVTPNAADVALVDTEVANHSPALGNAKATKAAAIDARTRELIAAGFAYNGKVFSLSAEAQSYWNGLGNLTANGLLTEPDDFPITVNTLDDADTYGIANIADAVGLFANAAATVKTHLASGTALKDEVRAATTVAGVAAVIDNR